MKLAILVTTLPNRAEARALARWAIAERLAACAQMTEITSIYNWEGAAREEEEVRLVLKTPGHRAAALMNHLAARHPYDEPELYCLEADAVSENYLGWTDRETRTGRD